MRNRYLYNYTGPMLMIVGLYGLQSSTWWPQKAFAVLGVCTWIFGAGGSVSVYLQHCEPYSGCKNLEKSIYSVGWTWWKMCRPKRGNTNKKNKPCVGWNNWKDAKLNESKTRLLFKMIREIRPIPKVRRNLLTLARYIYIAACQSELNVVLHIYLETRLY